MVKLPLKHEKFVLEWIFDGNITGAYKAAYPNVKNDNVAAANGSRLLRNAKVQKYIDEYTKKLNTAKIAQAAEVMEYLTAVMRGQSLEKVIVIEGTGEGRSAAREIEKSPDEKSRIKAAELLGKRYQLFTDKINLDGAVSVTFSGEEKLE